MIVISYYQDRNRVGMLAWAERPDGSLQALGGPLSGAEADRTLVQTDEYDRILEGSVHPDYIREITGFERDDHEVVELERHDY